MAPVIELAGVGFRYPGADRPSLTDVDLTIERGDFVAIVGGNGSGKTTLCKTFNGLIPHFWSGGFDGTVTVDGIDTRSSTVARLSRKVGYVYQDFGNQLVRPTVCDDVAFGPINFGLADWRERTERALDQLGISHLENEFVWALSGGQQHLAALAGVLALGPDVVVVDEPVAELDPARAGDLYDSLAALNERVGTTIIVIEHHAEFVARYCDSVVLVDEGSVRWHLPTRQAMARTDELKALKIPPPQTIDATTQLVPNSAIPLTVAEAAETIHRECGPPPLGVSAITETAPNRASDVVVASAKGVSHGYRNVHGELRPVLHNLDLDFRAGERVAVVGTNGAGKSTLLKLMTGLVVPRHGEIEVVGINTRTRTAAEMADVVCHIYQHPEQMFLHETVEKDIAMFPAERKRPGAKELVARILDELRMTELADRDGRTLSGGQQRRATLGIGLAMTPALLLLDEPTSSLDTATRSDVIGMLESLARQIRCVVVATHDMQLVAEWSTRVVVLDQGRVAFDGDVRGLFGDPALMRAANLVPPQITQLGEALGLDPLPLSVQELVSHYAPSNDRSSHNTIGGQR